MEEAYCGKTAEGFVSVRYCRVMTKILSSADFVGGLPKLWGPENVMVVGIPQMVQKGDLMK